MADVVNKLMLGSPWNGYYWCVVKFPDGTSQELKSSTDLNYTQWQEKVKMAWEIHINPPVEPKPVALDEATAEQVAAEIKERHWTAKDIGL